MSKIDKFNEQKRIYETVKDNLDKARGYDTPRNDKHTLSISFTGSFSGQWSDAVMHFHATYGYYGSSSGYRAMNQDVAKYLEKEINSNMINIARDAVLLAEKDMEKARKEAEDEAKKVLQQLEQA